MKSQSVKAARRFLEKHTAALTVPSAPSASWHAAVSTVSRTLPRGAPDGLSAAAVHCGGRAGTQDVGWEVPSHPRTVVGAISADGVAGGDEGQMGMFCWRQFNTDCPEGGKRRLGTAKQAAALLDAKMPSDSLHADMVSSLTPRMLTLLPRLLQLDGSVSKHELHIGTFALIHVRRFEPVKPDNKDPVKHPTAFTVPNTPSAAWHARASAVLRRLSSSDARAKF